MPLLARGGYARPFTCSLALVSDVDFRWWIGMGAGARRLWAVGGGLIAGYGGVAITEETLLLVVGLGIGMLAAALVRD